jgi:hypothetical protein
MGQGRGAKVKAVKESALQVLQEDYGLDRAAVTQLMQSTPAFRSSEAQRLVYDAVAYRLAQREAATKIANPVPPVQRPGVSQPRDSNDEVDAAMRRFRADPSPKSAAALLIARRAANR